MTPLTSRAQGAEGATGSCFFGAQGSTDRTVDGMMPPVPLVSVTAVRPTGTPPTRTPSVMPEELPHPMARDGAFGVVRMCPAKAMLVRGDRATGRRA